MKIELEDKTAIFWILIAQSFLTLFIVMFMLPAFNQGLVSIIAENEAYEWGALFYLAILKSLMILVLFFAITGAIIYFSPLFEKEEPPRKPEPPGVS